MKAVSFQLDGFGKVNETMDKLVADLEERAVGRGRIDGISRERFQPERKGNIREQGTQGRFGGENG